MEYRNIKLSNRIGWKFPVPWGGGGVEEVGRCWSKVNIQLRVSSGDLMYMVIIVSNNVYLKFAKRIDFNCSYHKKANIFKCIVKDFGFYVMINIICIFYFPNFC